MWYLKTLADFKIMNPLLLLRDFGYKYYGLYKSFIEEECISQSMISILLASM